jgi:hypothetical protein
MQDSGKILEEKPIRVSAYSGYKANERPLRFTFEEREHRVEEILDRWFGEDYDYFKVRTRDGSVFVIKWQRWLDAWFLVEKR